MFATKSDPKKAIVDRQRYRFHHQIANFCLAVHVPANELCCSELHLGRSPAIHDYEGKPGCQDDAN